MNRFRKMKIAVIGSGMISGTYIKTLQEADIVEVVGCSDIKPERSKARADEFNIRQMTNEEILADPEIEMVLNTTYPLAHFDVAKAALQAGKHVYTEKMTTETVEQANALIALAKEKHLFLGGAPDTFLCGGIQLARQILDSGIIGEPVMTEAFLSRSYHHERFFANNEKRFAFQRHGGIIFDMGAYYLTDMVFLLGAIEKVCGFSQIRNPHRVYQKMTCPMYGEPMEVESWNNVTGSIQFKNGALGTITATSEGGAGTNHFLIQCTDGKIDLGDPNLFESEIKLYNKKGEESIIKSPFSYSGKNYRGIGLIDAVYAIQTGRFPRCNADMNRHVLEAALGICESSLTRKTYDMKTTCHRPQPLATGYTENPELVFAG